MGARGFLAACFCDLTARGWHNLLPEGQTMIETLTETGNHARKPLPPTVNHTQFQIKIWTLISILWTIISVRLKVALPLLYNADIFTTQKLHTDCKSQPLLMDTRPIAGCPLYWWRSSRGLWVLYTNATYSTSHKLAKIIYEEHKMRGAWKKDLKTDFLR